jgi:hypothetical protein
VAAGLAWATLNAGFILLLSFGPKLLRERGAAPASANLVVSWPPSSPSPPCLSAARSWTGSGGATRSSRWAWPGGSGTACGAFALGGPAALWSALVGLLVAPAAGVVALPGEVLPARSRSTGFGLFYALYYACMGVVPVGAGYLVDRSGGAAAIWLAAGLWLLALPALGIFRVLQRRWPAVHAV